MRSLGMTKGKMSVAWELGPKEVAAYVRRRAWADNRFLGLRCDTEAIADPAPAAIPVVMERVEPDRFGGFQEELGRVHGHEYKEVHSRVRMCAGDVRTLFVATAPDGAAIYAQWLLSPQEHDALRQATGRPLRELDAGEMLVEGAYTFVRFRRKGAMADGMHQLLETARAAGAHRVFTYVGEDNVGSLRGCAAVGFKLDHVRLTRERLGGRRVFMLPVDDRADAAWAKATAPRART